MKKPKNNLDEFILTGEYKTTKAIEFDLQCRQLIHFFLNKWRVYPRNRQDKEDMIGEAYLGILEKIDGFDPEKGKFSTYVTLYVKGKVFKYFYKNVLNTTNYYGQKWMLLEKVKYELMQEGIEVTYELLSQKAKCSLVTIRNTYSQVHPSYSLHSNI